MYRKYQIMLSCEIIIKYATLNSMCVWFAQTVNTNFIIQGNVIVAWVKII